MPDYTDLIRRAVANNHYKLSFHAIVRMAERRVAEEEIVATIIQGEILERYPHDQPLPKCLFMYPVRPGQPLYVSCAYNERLQRAHIITIHWFDPERWIDWRTRRG